MDRLPPHSIDAERSVLGSLLVDPDLLSGVIDRLRPEDFYRSSHATIYRSMVRLFERRLPCDIITVADDLGDDLEDVGGRSELSSLSSELATPAHIGHYAKIVAEKALYRSLIGAAGRIAALGYDEGDDPEAVIDKAEAELYAAASRRISSDFQPLSPLLLEEYERLNRLHAAGGAPTGILSGFPDLDRLTGGFQRSDLVVVAARPGVGKTSFALNVAEAAARKTAKTGVFSLEMSKEQLIQRLLASVADLDSRHLRDRITELDFARVAPAMTMMSSWPLFIDDTPVLSVNELRAKARRLQSGDGLDLVVVDYLQLMNAPGRESRVQEVTEISRGLKALARELSVPVIALSQLSRQPENRDSQEPRLSDLRESGAIEQDSDLVMFLWRDKEKPDPTAKGETVNVKLAKHRNGPIGEFKLWFQADRTRFRSVAHGT